MQNEATFSWDDLRVLLAVHRQRSFLAAGKSLGMSTSTAARRIEALEASLGRPVVQRGSSGTQVEPDALELVTLAEQMEIGLKAAQRGGPEGDHDEALAGTVRISMGEGFLRHVMQFLTGLRRQHPALQLELISEDRMVDLARREADIGIRSARSSSPALVERHLGRVKLGLYVGQTYIDRRLRGGFLKHADFPRHDFLGYDTALHNAWLLDNGVTRFPIRSNSDLALVEAAIQGEGILLTREPLGRTLPALVQLNTDAELPSSPVYLAYHRDLKNVPRVRKVLQLLDSKIRDGLRA